MAQPPRKTPGQHSIFVNRETPLKLFAEDATNIPPDHAILRVFYGPGGQGKTVLCTEIANRIKAGAWPHLPPLHVAKLDFREREDMTSTQAIIALRNQFVESGISLPAFDIALALIWQQAFSDKQPPHLNLGWLTNNAEDLSEAGVELGQALAQLLGAAVDSVPLLGALRKLAGWFVSKGREAWLKTSRDWLKAFITVEYAEQPGLALLQWLPRFLAYDLNDWLAKHPGHRLVLLVDEYERFVPQAQLHSDLSENEMDERLRSFIAECNGLLAVFFLRTKLPWAEKHAWWREQLEGRQHLLTGLPDADAECWLRQEGVTDEALIATMLEGARESTEEDARVYPLFLLLQVEHCQELQRAGRTPTPQDFAMTGADMEARLRKMVGRLLRDFEGDGGEAHKTMLQALAVPSRFDEAVVRALKEGLELPILPDFFTRITHLSFVQPLGDGWHGMHRVLGSGLIGIIGMR